MNILVAGGAGFMGSAFVRYILRQYPEWRVVVYDKLTYAGNLANLEEVSDNPNYFFVHGDIIDKSNLVNKVRELGVDAIVNYAAETHVDRSIARADEFLKTEVLGTHAILEAVKDCGLRKLVQISTDEVYGAILEGAFSEESPFRPNSPYAAAKAGGDLLCRAYFATYRTPVVVTHSCNVYGPYQYPEKIIPLFIANLLQGKKAPVYGDGLQRREWIHADDHCRAIDAILQRAEPGSAYNIGTGDEIANIDLAAKLLSILGLGKEMIEHVADRPGHDRRYAINCDKLMSEFGWKPLIQFDEGLKKTVEWYKECDKWWKKRL